MPIGPMTTAATSLLTVVPSVTPPMAIPPTK
jgi:hypothetical protein